ncbi:cadherin-like beta sandwich domain-containing protein, partial [Clostridium sp.]
MNKNIKRTVAMALTLSALATIEPASSINILGAQEANAATSDKIYFDSLRVSGAGNIKLSDSKTKYSIYVPKSQESATITIKKDKSSDTIDVSGDGITDTQGHDDSSSTCKIKVDLDEKGSTANEYEVTITNADNTKSRTYTLKIYRKNVSSDDDEDNDDIYLDSINLSAGSIDFSRKKAEFDVVVDKDVDSIKIQAKPEDEDYKVEIGGEEVDEDCKWRTEVDLKTGKNVVEIYIEDEDDDDEPQRTYTLNIYRG